MTLPSKISCFSALLTLLLITSSPIQAQTDTPGALIYRGNTFDPATPTVVPLFRYERRVANVAAGLSATHLTRDPKGDLIITETALTSPNYELQRFDVVNQQSGFSGSVRVSAAGRHLEYELSDNGRISTASEDISEPVVSGPSMFGFILKNWDDLKSGKAIALRILVLREKTTYGFDLRFEKEQAGQTSFTVTPSNFFIRLAIAPLRVVFDSKSKNPVRYEGRVPPMALVSGKLHDLDARVEYTNIAPNYR